MFNLLSPCWVYDNIVHLAGLKAVRESHNIPLQYYNVNVIGSINLLEVGIIFVCIVCV